METIKTMLSSVTSDTRVLALLLAWGFGAVMEGMAASVLPLQFLQL